MAEEEVIIGGYKRVSILQTGQNSEVWEVAEVGGKQRYAMKLLLPDRSHDKAQQVALRHEARIGMKLEHPHIIRFYKSGVDRKIFYIVMEHFRSSNLKLQVMRGEGVKLRPKLRKILKQFSQALGYYHSKGWVHRDIKPDNVLVNSSAEVRLIDFAISVRAATGLSKLFAGKTKAAGTRSYMSPEQIRGKPLDQRADIYSTGVMLYEIITGKLPYVANSGSELLKKHLSSAIPMIPKETGVDPAFARLVQRMMGKDPSDRPASMEEFEKEIRGIKIFADEDLGES
ncbi:serine/threonine protein kinase [bacterium]|nr:serine/threonine protein kinase [bacterium]